mgnify:FL=1
MSLLLEERQSRTEMDITSVDFGETETVLTAEGNMGEYGRVYTSYHLSYNNQGTGGTYTGQGRGYPDKSSMVSGKAVGIWRRDGDLLQMEEVVSISDGTQNLSKITVNPREKKLTMDVFILL